MTRWIFLMFVLVLVACFGMSIYFYNTSTIVEKNLREYNETKVRQISMETDSASMRIATCAATIANAFEEKQGLIYSVEGRMEYISTLASLLDSNRDIFGIYVYLSETNEVITGEGIVKAEYFYSGHLDSGAISYESWNETLTGEKSNCFGFFPFIDMPRGDCDKITYMLNLTDGKGKVLVALNVDAITTGEPFLSTLLAMDADDNVYNLYGEQRVEFSPKDFSGESGELKGDDKGNYISCVESQIAGIKYMIFTEGGVLNKDLRELRSLSAFYIIAFLVIGFLFAYYFSIRQYKPLARVVDILTNGKRGIATDKKNEYEKIIDSVGNIVREKTELDKKAYRGEIYLRERAVSMLLNNRHISKSIREFLPSFKQNVGIVYILYDEEKAHSFENDFEMLQFAIKNIATEIFAPIGTVYLSATELAGTVCLLLSLNDDEPEKEKLHQTAKEFIDALKRELDVNSDVCFGRTTQNESEIPVIYGEVKEVALLCSYTGQVIDAMDYTDNRFDSYNYSIYTEMEIISCVKHGDYSGAYSIIKTEMDHFLYQRNCPIYTVRCFMVEIAGTILKAVGEIEKENEEMMRFPVSNNVAKLFSATTIAEMELLLQGYLKEVCEHITQNAVDKASPLCEKIKQYVKENYADVDMNVNAIARNFQFNSAYLSNMFKRNTGINLLAYINRVRIDEAKKLMLENEDISIEEVSERTGFSNSRSFRRIFQRCENIPPSKFKKS